MSGVFYRLILPIREIASLMITSTQTTTSSLKANTISAGLAHFGGRRNGGLLFGWDWVVIGGAKPFFPKDTLKLTTEAQIGWANSCALIGCLSARWSRAD